MRSFILATILSVLCVVGSADAAGLSKHAARKLSRGRKGAAPVAAFTKVCAKVKNVTGREFLYKSEISDHISGADPRSSGPTLICNQICPSHFPASLYYSDGTLATRLGYYGTFGGNGKPRAYCAAGGVPKCFISSIYTQSKQKRRDGKLYLQVSNAKTGPKTMCYRVSPLGRTGSVL